LFGIEVVDVGSVTYESEVEQPGGKLLAKAVDIHSGLRGPVDDVLQSLRGATGIHATGNSLPLGARDRLVADRAIGWHLEGVFVAFTFPSDGFDDLRDHIPRPFDDDRVAD
jgi:hypothetical protein